MSFFEGFGDDEIGTEQFGHCDDSSGTRAVNFSGNEVFVATVSMSMEQSDEMRYVASVAGNDLGSNDDAAATMLAVSRKKTRRFTTTTAAYSTVDQPLDIGIELVFGNQPLGAIISKPELDVGSGIARGNKRRILNKKNNPELDPPKKKSPNKTQSSGKGKRCVALAKKPKENNYKGPNNGGGMPPCVKSGVGNGLKSAKMLDFISLHDSKPLEESSNNIACECEEPAYPLKAKEIKKTKPKLKSKKRTKGQNQKTPPDYDEVEKVHNLKASAKFPKSNVKSTIHEKPVLFHYKAQNSSTLELCKNYAQQKCIKGYFCGYMHAEFPCKYYYLGLECNDISDEKNACKFLHGGPLNKNLLGALRRHIIKGPVDVVGKNFIDAVRSKKTVHEIEGMLREFQRKLNEEKKQKSMVAVTTEKTQEMVGGNKFLEGLRQKLHFLTEEQIESLKNLNVTEAGQAMHLTLWQLKSIGIMKASQLAAFMDVVGNDQDMDMGKGNLVPQTLSTVTAGLSLTNTLEIEPIVEEQTVVQDAAIAEQPSTSINNVVTELSKEPINSVKTLQQLSRNFLENKIRIATKKIAQRFQKIQSSNVQREDKRKELLDVINQLTLLEFYCFQEKAVENNKIFKTDTDQQLSYPVNNTANAIATPRNITQTSKGIIDEHQLDTKIEEDNNIETQAEDVHQHLIAMKTPLSSPEEDAADKINPIQSLSSPKFQIVTDPNENDEEKVTDAKEKSLSDDVEIITEGITADMTEKEKESGSDDVEIITEGITTDTTEKRKISTPCTNNLAGNIKPRRLRIPKREHLSTEEKNGEKAASDKNLNTLKPLKIDLSTEEKNGEKAASDKNLNTLKPLKIDVHTVPSVENQKTDKTVSLEVKAAGGDFRTISQGNNDWEDFIEETRIVTKLYESPAKVIKNSGQSENGEILDDLRYKIEDIKKLLKSNSSSRELRSPSKENKGYDAEQLRSHYKDQKCVVKQRHFRNNGEEGNNCDNKDCNKFTGEQRKVSRKYNNCQNNYKGYNKYNGEKLYNQKNENPGEVKYDSDEDWDKEEINNSIKSTTDNVNANAIVTTKTIATTEALAIAETKTTTTTASNDYNSNNNSNKPTYDHNTSDSNSISTEQISIIEASVPQSPVDKEQLESEQSILNKIPTSGAMKPDEVLNSDNWDGAEVASPTRPTVCDEIASPSYPSVSSSLSYYTPAMEIDGRMSFPTISYCLHKINIPKFEVNNPESLDKLLRSNSVDPRLLKYKEKSYMDSSNSSPMLSYFSPQQISQYDPRRRSSSSSSSICPSSTSALYYSQPDCYNPSQAQHPSALLYKYLHSSPWYQSLMSTMKIQINHAIAELVRALNSYHRERLIDATAIFDVFKIDCAGELLEIMRNIGIFIDPNGVIMEEKGYTQYDGRVAMNTPAPVNATYSFMPQILPTASNACQQSACPVALPPQMPTTSFVSCYIDTPGMVSLTPRRQAPINAATVTTPTPPPTEADEDEFGSVRENGSVRKNGLVRYYRNGNGYRKFDMDAQRRNDRSFWRNGEGGNGHGHGNGRRRRNGSAGFFNHRQRY